MRSVFLALATVTSVVGMISTYVYSRPVMVEKENRMWTHIVDPYGNNVLAPAQIRWDVDAASCGSNLDAIVSGMHSAEMTWRGVVGVDINRATQGERINLAVYCAPFSDKYSEAPRAYRIKHLETESDSSMKQIAVEVPSNWALEETSSYDDVYNAENSWWNARGTAHYVIGLALGVKHAYATGKKPVMIPLDDAQPISVCVARCDK
jgi:hypothetical protein